MKDQDLRRVTEAAYLNTDNTWRYRAILNFCYKKHEHMQTFVYPEDIWQELSADPHFRDYTKEQLEQDLEQLVAWKNLEPHQETTKAKSIDDFKRKKYRYQCTPATVEIERMVERLKNIGEEFGGSLETTQFDRILHYLREFLLSDKIMSDSQQLNQVWQDLEHYFRTMIRNASDYLAHLKSAKVEERMKTEAFIVYKDKFTKYLQTFILGLSRSAGKMEQIFRQSSSERENELFLRLAKYQLSIPHLGDQKSLSAWQEDFRESFSVMREWFLGNEHRDAEFLALSRETVETIRRITRFAQRLAEQRQAFKNRKADYLHLAQRFAMMTDKGEADCLSAMVFGANGSRHFYAVERENSADLMKSTLAENDPTIIELKPRTETFREKQRQIPVRENNEAKAAIRRAYLAEQQKLKTMLAGFLQGGVIDFAALPVLTREARQALLNWVACALRFGSVRTEMGFHLRLVRGEGSQSPVVLRSEDGDLIMPPLKLAITENVTERSETAVG